MKNITVNLNTLENIDLIVFSDNHPHIRLKNVSDGDLVNVICSITSPSKLFQLLEVANAIPKIGARLGKLFVPYLLCARYDRVMVDGDSFDLEIIADMINYCGFMRVELLDVHSDISLRLINRSHNNYSLLIDEEEYGEEILYICPDKGAYKRVPENAKDIIYCEKTRDIQGNITLKVNNSELAENRVCVILDDICDGGRTFTEIAKQLPQTKRLILAVTHGIFSKGLRELEVYFDDIITTNSLMIDYSLSKSKKLKVIDIY